MFIMEMKASQRHSRTHGSSLTGSSRTLYCLFAGCRVSLVAFVHSSAFSPGAKSLVDVMARQGFSCPEDVGKTKIATVPRALSDNAIAAAHRAYYRSCEEIMETATRVPVKQAKDVANGSG